MKKTIYLLFIFVCLSEMFVFAQNKVGWEGTTSGDYIIYKDNSWKDEAYLGFLYYNPSTIGTFLYIPSRSLRVTILFSVEELDGQLILTGQNITSKRSNDELYILAVNYLMDILPSLYAKKVRPTEKTMVIKRGRKTFDTVQFGPSCTFYYVSFLPLFYLESISDANGNVMLSIEKIGRIAKESDDVFFQFNTIDTSRIHGKQAEATLNEKAKKETISVEGISITLDSEWTKIADNSFFMKDVAFLTISRVKEAQFNLIEGDFASSAIKLFSMSRKETKLFYDKNELKQTKNGFSFSSLQYDLQTNKKIKDIKTVVDIGKEHIIISLTVDNAFYTKNKDYFDSIFLKNY